MTDQTTKKAITVNVPLRKVGGRHSVSYILSIAMSVYLLVQYYFPVFFDTEGTLFGYAFACLPILCFALAVVLIYTRRVRVVNSVFKTSVLFFCCAIFSILVAASGVERTFGLLSILLLLYVFQLEPLKGKERRIVLCVFTVVILAIMLNGVPGDASLELPEGKFNPNGCAFLLAMLFCVAVVKFSFDKKKSAILLCAICLVLQFVYISRTALIGIVMFAFLFLILKGNKKTFSHRSVFWAFCIFSMLGILLAYVYSEVLFAQVGKGNIFIFGKDIFTGREIIWNFTFESIREHFWFGVGSHLNETYYEAGYYKLIMNAHNQPLGMLASFGFPAFLFFYISFSLASAEGYRKKSKRFFGRAPAIFLFVITIMSYFDIYFFSAYNWIAIVIAYSLICSYSKKEKQQ